MDWKSIFKKVYQETLWLVKTKKLLKRRHQKRKYSSSRVKRKSA